MAGNYAHVGPELAPAASEAEVVAELAENHQCRPIGSPPRSLVAVLSEPCRTAALSSAAGMLFSSVRTMVGTWTSSSVGIGRSAVRYRRTAA